MIVLSLFDGMSCGYEALKRLGVHVEAYYASEIDKYAMQIAKQNHPDIIHVGDVEKWREWDIPWADIGLLIGGSPCQGFSFSGKQLLFDDPRSRLFFEYVNILNKIEDEKGDEVNFFLENVKMKKEALEIINDFLAEEPMFINSSLVSAQNRPRYYWFNWDAEMPKDRHIYLKDIILNDAAPLMFSNVYGGFKEKSPRVHEDKSVTIRTASGGGHIPSLLKRDSVAVSCNRNDGIKKEIQKAHTLNSSDWRGLNRNQNQNAILELDKLRLSDKAIAYMERRSDKFGNGDRYDSYPNRLDGKAGCLTANMFKGVSYGVIKELLRKLHPIECERLQTLPDNYTEGVSPTQRYKMLGNGWTVEVVTHILSFLPDLDLK